MSVSFADSYVRAPATVVSRAVGQTTVLLDTATGRYFSLDQVGTRAWSHLTTAASIEAAFEALLEEFDVERERLREELASLISRLASSGLLEVRRVGG